MEFFNEIKHQGMIMKYDKILDSFGMKLFSPGANSNNKTGDAVSPNFHLTVAGDNCGIHAGVVTGGSLLPLQCKCVRAEFDTNGAVFEYVNDRCKLHVTVNMQFAPGARVIRQINTVRNMGDEDIVLTHFSSMNVMGIGTDGLLPWYDDKKIRVHYCINTWEGEGQWRSATLEELGLYPNSVHQCNASIHINSIGSWSTARYFPAAMVEDIETGQIWYFQIETSSSWHYEIGHRKSADGLDGALYMEADAADEMYLSWHKTLKPGESFEAAPAAFGCTYGGFEEAVRELTKYRRTVLKPENAWKGDCPVVYNDYMNALWGNPTVEALIPLIDAAAEVGLEGFCMDCGWFIPRGESWGNSLGDWLPGEQRYGELGLHGVIDYIKSKGMIAGIWIEMEACQMKSMLYQKPDDWFLCRHGRRIGGERCFLDYRNPEVREYMHQCIKRLVDMGIGFFKNDYNQTTGPGDDKKGNSPADGLLEHTKAFYSFVDEVRERYPNLILENCGGGALRQDYGILSHFHLQSTSDQEQYYRYPSVITGTLANILPEQSGIWAYPYPLLFLDMISNPQVVNTEEFVDMRKDGEETIFNMVSGLCGNMYMSGHIDVADDLNRKLIRHGVDLYKKIRSTTHNSYPFWPTGCCRMNHDGYVSVGLRTEDGKKLYLAIWRLKTSRETIEIDLSKWTNMESDVKMIYPEEPMGVEYCFNTGNRSLTVKFEKVYSARFFEINN